MSSGVTICGENKSASVHTNCHDATNSMSSQKEELFWLASETETSTALSPFQIQTAQRLNQLGRAEEEQPIQRDLSIGSGKPDHKAGPALLLVSFSPTMIPSITSPCSACKLNCTPHCGSTLSV